MCTAPKGRYPFASVKDRFFLCSFYRIEEPTATGSPLRVRCRHTALGRGCCDRNKIRAERKKKKIAFETPRARVRWVRICYREIPKRNYSSFSRFNRFARDFYNLFTRIFVKTIVSVIDVRPKKPQRFFKMP